jgi:hypothetical protein
MDTAKSGIIDFFFARSGAMMADSPGLLACPHLVLHIPSNARIRCIEFTFTLHKDTALSWGFNASRYSPNFINLFLHSYRLLHPSSVIVRVYNT